MEIAGSTCSVCGQRVVLAREGKSCPACDIVIHVQCDTRNTCSRCGRDYESQQRPILDPAHEATVPRNLRQSAPASPVAMMLIGVFLIFLLFALVVMFFHH